LFLAQDLIGLWCAERLAASGPPDAFERLDWLATIGVMEDGHFWHDVLDVAAAGLARFPAADRLQLAQVLARTNIDLGSLRASSAVRPDLLTDEDLPSSVTGRIPKAIQQLEALLTVPSLAGEVELRAGYLELRRRKWQASLDRMDRAKPLLQDPALIATSDYFSGWIHEHLKEPVPAIAAYRRAHELAPLVRNLSTSLSALLFVNNEREEAYDILDRAFNAPDQPDDLLYALEHGDARYLPATFHAARELVR
jgi:tetratricopeptide (TPR) repeat protein